MPLPHKGDKNHEAMFVAADYGTLTKMAIVADAADGRRVLFKVTREVLDWSSPVSDEDVLMLHQREMRGLLQSIVDHAATLGIAAAGAPGTLRAKDDNLADLRGIVRALLPRRSPDG
jgi:hypothetical protein